MRIGQRNIGSEHPTYIIAEVGLAHEGSLLLAHSFIDATASAGADAVKFQTHISSAESSDQEQFRRVLPVQDRSRSEYWSRTEFSPEEWRILKKYSEAKGVEFLSSPFSMEAVGLLEELGVAALKIGSGEFLNKRTMAAAVRAGIPLILSTGLATVDEISSFSNSVGSGTEYALLQCSSEYPTSLNNIGLNLIQELREMFGVPTGLSDHSGTVWPSLAAISRDANILEVHVTFSRQVLGFDTESSVTFDELKMICEMRDAYFAMKTSPGAKKELNSNQEDMRAIFSKSLAPLEDIAKGTVITAAMLTEKKPGGGIPPADLDFIVGRRTRRAVVRNSLLALEDLEDMS